MSKKKNTVFVCSECGHESPKWTGQCSACGAWNSFVEEVVQDVPAQDVRRRTGTGHAQGRAKASLLKDVGSAKEKRIGTGIGELDRVLGGGLVPGSLVLISGEPGIGKSTLIMQAAQNIALRGKNVLYVSGEESEEQIKMRALRICPSISPLLYILTETNMENILSVAGEVKPDFLIIDSIQTMYTEELTSAPGSVSQVRACGNILMKLGKENALPLFLVAHVTKSGDLAGPKIVEHLVDAVLLFTGERDQDLRILRSFKNRFGTTSEIGAFRMEEEGLIPIEDLSATFVDGGAVGTEGSVVSAVYEGSRPVLLEIQALTVPAGAGFARRTAVGADGQRLAMILAVLERKAGLALGNQDVYVNVVGGLKPDSTSIDLAAALAIYSTARRAAPPGRILAIGEIGLTGDLKSVPHAEQIAREAARLGYEAILMPDKNAEKLRGKGIDARILGARTLRAAIATFSHSWEIAF